MTAGVAALLPSVDEDLRRWVRRHAGRLLARETADDLVQAIHARALEHGADCVFARREAFLAWLYKVAASHLADRHVYWSRQRRRSERLLRLTRAGSTTRDPRAVREPAVFATGPGTRAGREEDERRAVRALEFLLPRDRALIRWFMEDVPLAEQADRLGVTYTAVRQARQRALQRYRIAFDGPGAHAR